jgi:hypothetical protein
MRRPAANAGGAAVLLTLDVHRAAGAAKGTFGAERRSMQRSRTHRGSIRSVFHPRAAFSVAASASGRAG